MTLLLLLVIAALVMGILGVVIKGLLWLFALAVVLMVASLVGIGFRSGRHGGTGTAGRI